MIYETFFLNPKIVIEFISEIINKSVPAYVLTIYIYLAFADWITGAISALYLRKFISKVGITGILRKINVVIGYIAFCIVTYAVTKEHNTGAIIGYIIIIYELNSIFENIAKTDRRIGLFFKQIHKKTFERFLNSYLQNQENDKKKN